VNGKIKKRIKNEDEIDARKQHLEAVLHSRLLARSFLPLNRNMD